jgi:hypothetical protein
MFRERDLGSPLRRRTGREGAGHQYQNKEKASDQGRTNISHDDSFE